MAKVVKNPPAMQETSVRFLGQEDPLEQGYDTHSSILGFPCGSADKESTYNLGDLGSIPGSGRFPGEGIGYPLQYSWASLVAQTVSNPPAMGETWIRSLGWEDPLEEGMATHSNILTWRIPWTEEASGLQSMGSQRDRHR